jgi:hypothetical protein
MLFGRISIGYLSDPTIGLIDLGEHEHNKPQNDVNKKKKFHLEVYLACLSLSADELFSSLAINFARISLAESISFFNLKF